MIKTTFRPTTAKNLQTEAEAYVVEFCADHVVTLSEDGQRITFGKPGTSVYRQHFRIDGGFLMTYGDLGEAIYQWSSPVTWEFLAGCGFTYFCEKCQASYHGRNPRGWDGDVAETALRRYFEKAEDHGSSKMWEDLHEEIRYNFDLSSKDEWFAWLRDNGREWFGDDWWESVAVSCGRIHDTQTLHQWKMLKLAVAALEPTP